MSILLPPPPSGPRIRGLLPAPRIRRLLPASDHGEGYDGTRTQYRIRPYHAFGQGPLSEAVIEADSAGQAAWEYVRRVHISVAITTWVHVWVAETPRGTYSSPRPTLWRHHVVQRDPEEPPCSPRTETHQWQRPWSIVGGPRDTPGLWVHGGGVLSEEVCPRCGWYRVIDTWASDPISGERGLRSVTYEPPDERSLALLVRRVTLREGPP